MAVNMTRVDFGSSASLSLPIRPFPIMSDPSRQGHDFSAFFQEQQQQTPFFQKPMPRTESLRMERKPSTVERSDGGAAPAGNTDLPLWRRLPTWVPIVCWISTSSFVILQNKHILSSKGFSHPVVRDPSRFFV